MECFSVYLNIKDSTCRPICHGKARFQSTCPSSWTTSGRLIPPGGRLVLSSQRHRLVEFKCSFNTCSCASIKQTLAAFYYQTQNNYDYVIFMTSPLVCQMEVSSLKGCLSVSQETNSYTQNSELRWNSKNIKQGMKYQVFTSAFGTGCCFKRNVYWYVSFAEGCTRNAQPSVFSWIGKRVSCALSFTLIPGEDPDQPQRPSGAHSAFWILPSAACEHIPYLNDMKPPH